MQTATPTRSIWRRLFTFALIVSTAVAFCLLGLKILHDIDIRFRTSTELIEEMIEKAGIDTSKAEPFYVGAADGNTPEIVIWASPVDYAPDSPAAREAISTLTKACRDLGLGPMQESLKIHYPDGICDGKYVGTNITVSATVWKREDGRTYLTIESHAL